MGLYLLAAWTIAFLHWWALLIPAIIALVVLLVRSRRSIGDGGTTTLLKEFVRAKKERYCPKIDFTE